MRLADHDDRRAALRDFQHNLVVTAGAGTGKTSLLVGRLIAALVLHHLEPHQILAVTFTENAAAEMRERLIRMLGAVEPWLRGEAVAASDRFVFEQLGLGPENLGRVRDLLTHTDRLSISTFHGFCLRFLREHARRLDLPPDLRVADAESSHPGLDQVFLDCLREASDGEVHPALRRYDPTELRDLAGACAELPEDSLDRIVDEPPRDLGQRLGDLLQLVETCGPRARDNWRSAAEDLAACYRALLQGSAPESVWVAKSTPKAGQRELGAEVAEAATAALDRHRRFLAPWVLADREGIALALDFVRPVIRRYRQQVSRRGELGFQDLLLVTRRCLQEHGDLRQEMARRLHAIMVDEFQDTDPLQYDVVFLLAAAESGPPGGDPMELRLRPACLFIVGDAKQSIYRFRRADVAAFSRAVDCISAQGGRRLQLVANFRSRRPILDLVNAVCAKSLAEDRPYQFGYTPVVATVSDGVEGPLVEVIEIESERELQSGARREREGNLIVERIAQLERAGTPLGDIAVLLRAATDTSWILRPLRAAGIGYVLEGSRRFYQRQEIVLCRSLLDAMARPHDPVAVLALLRSALSDATDGDIHDHLQRGLGLDFRVGGGAGPVAECLGFLREVHARVADRPVDEALSHLLALPELRLAEAGGFEGAQRLANVERLLHKLLASEPLDLLDAASSLAKDTEVETDDEESPLYDGGADAVRLLTVHRAKGLEFEVVFVPDLARPSRFREPPGLAHASRLFDEGGREMVTVRIGDSRNVAQLQNGDAAKRHEEAEQRRLFYVAATRARRQLVLLRGESASRRSSTWQEDLEQAPETFERRLRPGDRGPRVERRDDPDPAPALRAHAAFRRDRDRFAGDMRAPDRAPSRKTGKPVQQMLFDLGREPAPRPAPPDRRPAPDPATAVAIGDGIHTYLARVDLQRADIDGGLLQPLPEADQVEALATRFHRSAIRRRLTEARQVARELPVSFVERGEIVHGVIDALIHEPDGALTILDWKSDRIAAEAAPAHAERYREQLTAYAIGVQRAFALERPPRTCVHFLSCDVTVAL